jgi:hypothetical protein
MVCKYFYDSTNIDIIKNTNKIYKLYLKFEKSSLTKGFYEFQTFAG